MIRWLKEWRRRRKEKLFREYEAWRHAQNQPKPGPSFNCRCYVEPYPLTEKYIWTAHADPTPRQSHFSYPQTVAGVKEKIKKERKVKSKKKLTAGKHGKKLQTTKRKNKQ